MAAYAALVSLLNDLELIPNHATHSFSFDDKQISSLSQTVEILIDFIESYDSHGCTREAAEVLESRVASAAHAAHDVIEFHIVDQIRAGSTRGGKFRSYLLLDLQRAIDNMEFVKTKVMQFKAKSGLKAKQPSYSSSAAAATSSKPLKDNVMVGFDEVVLQLMEILTGEPSDRRLVIPITGMGGLGKTSLAKTVYQHTFLEDHFDVRLWANISQQYSAESIFTELLYGDRKFTTGGGDVSAIGEELHKMLYGRRYLIVLDDMWSEGAWDKVYRFLPDNGNGSRVVVTTRLSDLAAHLSSSPFKLNFLDEDKSWELFCGKIFGGGENCPVELEEIGKKIVKRCRGLPLSIIVMGGHLRRSSRATEYWEKVANYMNPISSIGEEEQCLEILSLSYQHLPACLKPCFLYLGIFMEDESINASQLINMWIGEGFLKPKNGLSLEEVGEYYLKDLIDRNLILVEESNWNGKVQFCEIHDNVRELCLKICKKEKFISVHEDSTQVIGCTERRIVIPKVKRLNSNMIGVKQLASLLRSLVHQGGGGSLLNELLADCSLLRVLVHENYTHRKMDGTCLSLAHSQQVNLRALACYEYGPHFNSSVYFILSSISTCWNLQTLCMMSPSEPINLPYEIWEMPQLRHLQVYQNCLPDPTPPEVSNKEECTVLQNLHTLEEVVNLRLTDEVCERMPNLKRLRVVYNYFCEDYCLHNLGRFDKLKWLKIEFNDDPKSLRIGFDDGSKWCDVVLSLTFPTSLEELYLKNCHLHWEDLTMMISSLPHLVLLDVQTVHGCEWNLDEEEFCCLKILQIYGCDDLIHWNANSSNFPVLESLVLADILKLSEIPLDIGEIPTLGLIALEDCSVSAAVSAMRMVMEQETDGNYDLQLHVRYWGEECERFQEMLQQECLTSKSLHLYDGDKKIKTF